MIVAAFFAIPGFGQDVRLINRTVLKENANREIISLWADFLVLSDRSIIVTDVKQGNFKRYDSAGTYLGTWGRKGQGPEEFQAINFCDSEGPYLVIQDTVRRRVSLYEILGPKEIDFVKSLSFAPAGRGEAFGDHIEFLDKNRIMIDVWGMIAGQEYALYMLDLRTGELNGVLSVQDIYGGPDEARAAFKKTHTTVHNPATFFAVLGEDVVYLGAKKPEGLLYSKKEAGVKRFALAGKNLRFQKPLTEAEYSRLNPKTFGPLYKKYSHINGLFSTNQFIGVVFSNYIEKDETWQPFVQIYDVEGVLVGETARPEAKGDKHPACFYDRVGKVLYLMNDVSDDSGEVERTIYAFRVSR